MMTQQSAARTQHLQQLCTAVRKYTAIHDYQKCVTLICKAMGNFPSAPQPHNLFGIVLEKEGDHAGAMRHFRAAYALDPSYMPSRVNLESFGTFYSCGQCAFDESNCPKPVSSPFVIEYDEKGIGHAVRKDQK